MSPDVTRSKTVSLLVGTRAKWHTIFLHLKKGAMMGTNERAVDDDNRQTLKQRIGDNVVDLINYSKHNTGSGNRITGKALLIDKIPNLSVIEVILPNASINDLLAKLSKDDVIVTTDSGLHIYADIGAYNGKRTIKCNGFEVHIRSAPDDSLVTMAGSKVRKNHRTQITTYSFIRGSYDSILTRTIRDVLNDLSILENEERNVEQVICKIDLKDDFTLTSMIGKAENGQYTDKQDVVSDLSRVIRRIDGEAITFVKKIYDIHAGRHVLAYVSQSNMRGMLKAIKLWMDEDKIVTAWNILEENLFKLSIKGVKFNSSDENILSIFQGYKYEVLDDFDISIITDFLNLNKEVICGNNAELYNYVISWIAHMIQHPGVKNETALILKGLQGIGKNTFTDVISELLAGYSAKNITDISELTGNFNSVVESKMFIVLNELSNCGVNCFADFNSLKSIITDDTIRINEKNQPRRTAENVANFIFVTNNSFPVRIELGDRRYVVLAVSATHKGDIDYFAKLHASFTKEFYDNLLTFFIKYDIKGFNPRNIPMTEAKQDLIEASRSEFDEWINAHYSSLINGIPCSEALLSKPSGMSIKFFQLQLKDRCDRKQKRVGNDREWQYILKAEFKEFYKASNEM